MKTINLTPERIEVRFPYSVGMVTRVKQIPFARWDNDATCWYFPISKLYAQHLQTLSNEMQFSMDNGVYNLLRSNGRKEYRDNLYPFQNEAVDFIHTNNGTCLVADDVGIGKTIEALIYAREADVKSMLVVCPASVLYKWQDETSKWTGWDSEIITTGKQVIQHERVAIMSYKVMLMRVHELCEHEFGLIVWDECHRINNPKARSSIAAGMLRTTKRLFLSGTPMLNRPIELWSILHMMDSLTWKSYWAYATKYAGAEKKSIWTKGGRRDVWDTSGATNLDELKQKISPVVIRRTRQEVLSDLPDLTRTKIMVDISRKEYNSALLDFKSWLKANGSDATANALTKLNFLRQIIGNGKVESAIELAQEILQEPDRKVVLYAHHRSVVQRLKESLHEYGVDTIVGDDSNLKRAETARKFQNESLPRVLVISSAGGEGIDLWRASVMIMVEREWNDSKEVQAEGRLHRNGQTNSVLVYYLVAHNTIDEDIDELISKKRDTIGQVMWTEDIRTLIINRIRERR